MWLQGWTKDYGDGISETVRPTPGSAEDKRGRLALAQLLADCNPPREILDLMATLFAPDANKRTPVVGEHISPSGSATIDLSLGGSGWVLSLPRRRDNARRRDPALVGAVLLAMQDKVQQGMSIEKACFEISVELRDKGVKRMSERNIKPIRESGGTQSRLVRLSAHRNIL